LWGPNRYLRDDLLGSCIDHIDPLGWAPSMDILDLGTQLYPAAVFGEKLSPDGALLFQPLVDGLAVSS
jgi:hypothetical protein